MSLEYVFFSALSIAFFVIGYFLRSIHGDHKKTVADQQQMKIESIRMQGSLQAIERKSDSDNKLWEERIGNITRIFEKQTIIIEELQKSIIHLDKNTANIKVFFEKYEKVDDKQIELEKRVAHLEAIHESNGNSKQFN